MLQKLCNYLWYNNSAKFIPLLLYPLLYPLTIIYMLGFKAKKIWYNFKPKILHSVPIITVGNITVGGTGKTPMIICLGKFLQNKGLKIAVISRGYKSNCNKFPAITSDNPNYYGDEPVLIAKKLNCPVVIDPNRNNSIKLITEKYNVDIILSDDGLQNFSFQQNLKIMIIDGIRHFGNGLCLPAGPLREPYNKNHKFDFVIVNNPHNISKQYYENQYISIIKHTQFKSLITDQPQKLDYFFKKKIAAITGIANPKRFFDLLRSMGLEIIEYEYSDHYNFTEVDLDLNEDIIIMTEKDAVKCLKFANIKCYYLEIELQPEKRFFRNLENHIVLKDLINNAKNI